MGMRKALTERQALDLIFEVYDQQRKGERTAEEVSEDFGVARPSYYRYRSTMAKRLEKIGENLDNLLENSNTAEDFRESVKSLISAAKEKAKEKQKETEPKQTEKKQEPAPVQSIRKEIKKDLLGEMISQLNRKVEPLQLKPSEPEPSEPVPSGEPSREPEPSGSNKFLLYGGIALIGVVVLLTMKGNRQPDRSYKEEPAPAYRPNYITAMEF